MFILVPNDTLVAIIAKMLLEYSKLFFSFADKTYIVNVNFTKSARTIFRFPFLNLILKNT